MNLLARVPHASIIRPRKWLYFIMGLMSILTVLTSSLLASAVLYNWCLPSWSSAWPELFSKLIQTEWNKQAFLWGQTRPSLPLGTHYPQLIGPKISHPSPFHITFIHPSIVPLSWSLYWCVCVFLLKVNELVKRPWCKAPHQAVTDVIWRPWSPNGTRAAPNAALSNDL